MLAYWGTLVAIFATILTTFGWLDARAPRHVGDSIRAWMAPGPDTPTRAAWTEAFLGLFNAVFAERALSWRFFLRSCLASLVLSGSIFVIAFYLAGDLLGMKFNVGTIYWVVLMAAAANFVPDYISLITSRWIIRKIGAYRNIFATISLMIFDVVFTVVIFLVLLAALGPPVFFIASAVIGEVALEGFAYKEPASMFGAVETAIVITLRMLPFFCSTFLTSVWVWLFVVGSFIMYSKRPMLRVVRAPLVLIDVKKYPLSAIGLASGWVFVWCYLAVGGVYLVIS